MLVLLFAFGLVAIAAHKLFDASRAVYDFLLTSIKRVRKGAYFNVHDVMVNTINVAGLACLDCRDASPLVVAVHINDGVVIWVSFSLHGSLAPDLCPHYGIEPTFLLFRELCGPRRVRGFQ